MNDIVPLIVLVMAVFLAVIGMRAAVRRRFRPDDRRTRQPPRRAQRRPQRTATPAPPPVPEVEVNSRSILVDGSNVMHWIDNKPSIETLQRVLAKLRNAGNDPILCFDANIGYKLVGQFMDATDLAKFFGTAKRNILICPSGTDGDAMILRLAVEKSLPVVSNDKYRDYPDLVERISTMTGRFDGAEPQLRFHDVAAKRRQSG